MLYFSGTFEPERMFKKMAGFFGLFNYSKEGPGVSKHQPKKKRFFYFWELYFRKFWKLITLNLLYFAMCIPIVTIGAATAGFTFVLRKMSNEEPVFLASDFFEGFRKNWKQSTVIFVLDILLFFMLPFAIWFYSAQTGGESGGSWLFYIPMALCMSALLIYVLMHYYIHLLIVTTNLKLKHILKNSFFLACIGLKTNLITTFFVVIVVAITLVLCFFFVFAILLVPTIVLSTVGFIVCYNSYQYILKYVIEPYYRDIPLDEIPDSIKRTLHIGEEEDEDEEAVFRDMGQQETAPSAQKQPEVKGKKNKTIS